MTTLGDAYNKMAGEEARRKKRADANEALRELNLFSQDPIGPSSIALGVKYKIDVGPVRNAENAVYTRRRQAAELMSKYQRTLEENE